MGRNHQPINGMAPLREIISVARHCCGGVILGFCETHVKKGSRSDAEGTMRPLDDVRIATSWNQLEAGILLGTGLPILVCREKGLEPSAIFDPQVGDRYIVDLEGSASEHFESESARRHYLGFYTEVVNQFAS